MTPRTKTWVTRGVGGLGLCAALVTALVATHALGSVDYLSYLATRGELIDTWAVLSLLDVLAALGAAVGAWLFLRRRQLICAAALLALPWITSTVIEASRCDVVVVCRTIGWAALPRGAFDWSIRIRDVSVHEAELLAYKALRDASLPYSPLYPTLSNGRWRVATFNDDMVRMPYDVVIEAQTGAAQVVKR